MKASLIRIPGRRNDNVGPRRRWLGPGVRRRVRAGGRRQLHPLRGEGEDGPGHRRRRRRAAAQRLHGSGGRQDGAVHRQLRFPEAEGRRLPLLRAQAVAVARRPCCARGGRRRLADRPRQGGGKRGTTTGEVPACMLCLGLYLSDLERRERLS